MVTFHENSHTHANTNNNHVLSKAMFVDRPFTEGIPLLIECLKTNGIFLVVENNPITVGWVNIGMIWSKPMITVMVRKQRHTHALMEKASHFSLCLPHKNWMTEQLELCGTHSGKNLNKIKEFHLKSAPGYLAGNTILTDCNWFYEAEIVHKNEIDPKTLSSSIKNQFYFSNDYHTVYYGEIKHSYKKD
ncbi:MAG: flavin reductase [Oligoflexia bacterium]|nr:flavin reductase [Oligoflexia bacterium]MBF0365889.1 flavin reductase [Oligoflexia bacterium]